MKFDKNYIFYGLLYLGIVILTYLFFIFQDIVKSKILFAIIFAGLILGLIILLKQRSSPIEEPNYGFVRYVMSCHDCGWEWMSNITEKDEHPSSCPHCKAKHIEVIGWRKIKMVPKKEKDLREFID